MDFSTVWYSCFEPWLHIVITQGCLRPTLRNSDVLVWSVKGVSGLLNIPGARKVQLKLNSPSKLRSWEHHCIPTGRLPEQPGVPHSLPPPYQGPTGGLEP